MSPGYLPQGITSFYRIDDLSTTLSPFLRRTKADNEPFTRMNDAAPTEVIPSPELSDGGPIFGRDLPQRVVPLHSVVNPLPRRFICLSGRGKENFGQERLLLSGTHDEPIPGPDGAAL